MGVRRQNRPGHRKRKAGGFFCTLQNNEDFATQRAQGRGGGREGRDRAVCVDTLLFVVGGWGGWGGGGTGQLLRQHLFFLGGEGGRTVASTLALCRGGDRAVVSTLALCRGGQDICVNTCSLWGGGWGV